MNSNGRIDLFNGVTLDLARGCVTRSGEPVHLRPQAYEVLRFLVENRGHLISKDRLIEEVWKGRAVTDGALGKCIEEVREALGPEAKQFIRNVRGRGYIFDTGFEEPEDNVALSTQSEQLEVLRFTVEDHEELPERALPPAVARRRSNSLKLILAVAGALAVIGAVFIGYRILANRATPAQIESLAVLPFVNESGNSDVEYLSDGMTESLINSLSQIPRLSVKARSSVFRFKGKVMEPQTIAAELSVQAILNGRVVQRGDNLTLYLSLIDGRNGNQIWGEQYDRKLTDLVALQKEIARDVSHKLRARLSRADDQKVARNYTDNAEAYQLYLKGRYHYLRLTRSEVDKAIAYYQQAIAIDRSYALAYTGLSQAYRALALTSDVPSNEALPKAKAAALRALEIDEMHAEAHTALGVVIYWYDWDWNAAEKHFLRALELDPTDGTSHMGYAQLLSSMARHEQALSEARRGRELDPVNLRSNAVEGQAIFFAGKYDEAIVRLQQTIELDPNFWLPRLFLARVYIEKKMYAEALAEATKASDLSGGNAEATAHLVYALAKSGKQKEARSALDELKKRAAERHVPPYAFALSYNGLGETDEAIKWLVKGLEQRDVRMVLLTVDPKWNNLRSDARFQDLLRRAGFTS